MFNADMLILQGGHGEWIDAGIVPWSAFRPDGVRPGAPSDCSTHHFSVSRYPPDGM